MMMIQMTICIVFTYLCVKPDYSFHPLGADSGTLALRQRSYISGGHSA
jgi:hypothetical protein